MGKEQPAGYYDQAYKKSVEYQKHWSQSRYLKVWERMVQRFEPNKTITDLGCGVGQTFGFLKSKGFDEYFGIDFSEQAIEMAKKSYPNEVPMRFRCADIFEYLNRYKKDHEEFYPPSEQQIFCSETLEHIEKDVELLDLLRSKFPGSRIAISVPTFDDPGHVRHFKSTAEVKMRYCPFIKVDDVSQIGPWIILQGVLTQKQ